MSQEEPQWVSVVQHDDVPECPFCHRKEIRSFKDDYGYRVICYEGDYERDRAEEGCGIMTSPHTTREGALKTWCDRSPR